VENGTGGPFGGMAEIAGRLGLDVGRFAIA
jgi:hypothetical protein